MRRLLALLLTIGATAACTGEDPNLTASGKGKPVVTVAFPENAAPGDTAEAAVTISDPGPGDMRTIVVAFATVGPLAGQSELPTPIVGFGSEGGSSVLSIEPEPNAVSEDGVVYTFGPLCPDGGEYPDDCPELEGDPIPRLAAGDSITITFLLRVPLQTGTAANSIQVYEGGEIDRAGGVRLETLVGG
jgi:hypothetical protein